MTKLPCLILFAGALLASGPAMAQNARQRVPPSGSSGGSSGESGGSSGDQGGAQPRQAVPRDEGGRGNPRIERAERAEPARTSPPPAPSRVPPPAPVARAPQPRVTRAPETAAVPPPAVSAPAPEAAPQAVPRDSRPRGDNPRTGSAVERPPYRGGGRPDRRGDTRIYTTPRVYNNYYYYPRRSYPYGYGAFGLGYFYYDPYTWYPGYYYGPYSYYPGRPYGYYDRGYVYGIGSLRIEVKPRDAEVYVDGYFAGRVDDFDGTFQALELEEGPYRIEVAMPGFETLEFNIRIQPGRKITYRGELRREGRPRP